MFDIGLFLFILNLGVGLLFLIVSIPLLKGMVGTNMLYGFRIGKAFQSEENWQKINRHGARGMLIWSIVLMALSPISLFVDLEGRPALTILFSLMCCLIFIPIANTLLYARHL